MLIRYALAAEKTLRSVYRVISGRRLSQRKGAPVMREPLPFDN
jgi:hypothetical protein